MIHHPHQYSHLSLTLLLRRALDQLVQFVVDHHDRVALGALRLFRCLLCATALEDFICTCFAKYSGFNFENRNTQFKTDLGLRKSQQAHDLVSNFSFEPSSSNFELGLNNCGLGRVWTNSLVLKAQDLNDFHWCDRNGRNELLLIFQNNSSEKSKHAGDENDEHSKMISYWRRLLPISLSPFTLAASVSTSFRRIDITLKTRNKSHHQWLIDLTVTTYPHSQLSEFFLLSNILPWANSDLLLPECLPPWFKNPSS